MTKAVGRFLRVSPSKARLLANVVRGKRVEEALAILQYSPQAAARLIEKVLRSAIANAEHNLQIRGFEDLQVAVIVDGGPRLKRIQPRAMGRAFRILHRTSHITVMLSASGSDSSRSAGAPGRPGPEGATGRRPRTAGTARAGRTTTRSH